MIQANENKALLEDVIPAIVSWYRQNKKDFPWRKEPTPYHVWISEIMLQQTRIEAALGFYTRFIEALPTVEALAQVEDDHLMKLWQGLGYYSRARNLKKAAIMIVERYGGVLPDSAEQLRLLPGIGDYTAGAIASIAYGKNEPAVDGNVLRVTARIFAYHDDVMLPATKKDVTALLAACYPEGAAASLLTEGLMELGEVVCLPSGEVRCAICPVADFCRARQEGLVEHLPVRNARKEKRVEDKTVLLIRSDEGRFAIRKRENKGLLADMWEFPCLDGIYAEGDVESYLAEHGICVSTVSRVASAKHIFTHVIWQMQGFSVSVKEEGGDFHWKTPKEILDSYAIPSAYRAFLKLMNN